jgi:hypothetical protein
MTHTVNDQLTFIPYHLIPYCEVNSTNQSTVLGVSQWGKNSDWDAKRGLSF